VGLVVHWYGAGLGPDTRDALGDALWAVMIAWWVGVVAPCIRLAVRGAMAYGVCVALELSQLYHAPWLDAVRATPLGHLVLGSGFDARDLAAYAGGVAMAALLEVLLARRGQYPRRPSSEALQPTEAHIAPAASMPPTVRLRD
jgi:hypothetical protein